MSKLDPDGNPYYHNEEQNEAAKRDLDPQNQLRREIWASIRRYGQESGITVYTAIGVLEMVKAELIEALSQP